MTGINKIKERIMQEAKQNANENIETAKKEEQQIVNSAELVANEKKGKILEEAEKTAKEIKRGIISSTEMEAKKEKLMSKQNMVDKAFDLAINKLRTLPSDQYENLIEEMIIQSTETGEEELILNKVDKNRINNDFLDKINKKLTDKGLKGNIKFSEKTVNILGGFILKNEDIELNNSFETLFKIKQESLEMEVYQCLFSKETH